MTYIRVRWIHEFHDETILLFSELDAERFETRKVEVFRDGRQGFASGNEEHGGSLLGIESVPELNVIASDPEFEPVAISASEFEIIWAGRFGNFIEHGHRDSSI